MIRTKRSHLDLAAVTHPGMSGKNNEDRYAVTSYRCGPADDTPALFAVVADGIGGHQAGEVAAELAVDHISEVVAASDGRRPLQTLEQAIQLASESIADHASVAAGKEGMGATCACVWVLGDRLYTAWVGDTRIYLLRDGRLQQLTIDHTWVQEAMERGILTAEQARNHPNVHVIRRYLGSPEPPEVDLRLLLSKGPGDTLVENNQGTRLHPGDVLVLCTDGLSDLVRNDEIDEIISSHASLKEAAHALVDTANRRGGHDNITVLLLSVPREAPRRERADRKGRRWPWVLGGTAGLLLLAALAAVLLAHLLRAVLVPTPTPTPSPSPAPTLTSPPAATRTPLPTLTPWVTEVRPAPSGTPVGTLLEHAFEP